MPGISITMNSNAQEKSRGVVLFAYNTSAVDYVKIADQAAALIHKNLQLPVTLITDSAAVTKNIDQIIKADNSFKNSRQGYASGTAWRNGDRYMAYELSPYDETLLLDSDYLQLDSSLLKILDTTHDYSIMSQNQSPAGPMQGLLNPLGMHCVWATAIAFNKTQKSKMLFDLVGRIQRNYSYYRKLYQIHQRNFRNDYAFTLADHILNGYCSGPGIPWSMFTIDQLVKSIELVKNNLVIREQESAHVIPVQNIHIMDKDFLTSEKFEQLVEQLCQN